MPTYREYEDFVLQMASEKTLSTQEHWYNTAALGLAGECGEVVDLVKKLNYHGISLTEELRQKFIKELGDVEWYKTLMYAILGVTPEEVWQANMDKLNVRYKSGTFTTAEFMAKEAAKDASHS